MFVCVCVRSCVSQSVPVSDLAVVVVVYSCSYQWEIPITYATSDNTDMDKTRDDIRWLSKNRNCKAL